ncbi:MAG: RNB domain-containing ribonuclease [Cryomorphaceae bacterium]|nr:RNB domain-containing ribonuclease [Cryomorphaceae bacterium]
MSKKKGSKPTKMKNSLLHIVRKVFDKNPDSVLSHKQVCVLIDIRENALRKLVFDVLQDLAHDGFLQSHAHGVYSLSVKNGLVEGTIELTARGAGFVVTDDEESDVFIAPQNLGQALNGDRVRVRIFKRGKTRNEGEVISVLEREKSQYVGTIELHDKFAFLVPDNLKAGTDIYISKEKLNGAKNGDKALVKITVWPKTSDNPYGEVVEVLGKPGSNDTEMISILCNHGIDYKFPQGVLAEAEGVGMDLDEKEIATRRDMRDLTTFTIDPVDAKDFDDALSFRRMENGHIELGVHIADVSHYVRPGSAMDTEALKRSNSVYLVDRVVPMLPEQLSNMACSLRPNEDKYSFSVVFEIDEAGMVHNQWFGKTVIHSDRRFSYEQAQEIIEGKDGDFKEEILILDKIAKILRKSRLKHGALSIESEEMRFRLNDDGHPVEVMIHDRPDAAKIALFNVFIEKFGYKVDARQPDKIAHNMNTLLDEIRHTPEYSLIQTMAIRSMAKATYETDNIGHYGLAFDFYTHFTSPIRRYADLVVHRILQEELTTKKHRYGKELADVCKRISRMERKAVEAERESTKYFQTVFVKDHVGEVFTGIVSGIAEFGLFVRMDGNQCEGMVPMVEIPGDRYFFDADKYRIVGSRFKKEYNFGDKVTVRISEVHTRKRQIDLELLP